LLTHSNDGKLQFSSSGNYRTVKQRKAGAPRPMKTAYGQKIETAQRRQRSNIFGLGPVLHNKLAVDA
jgi:hypothetical protein